MRRRILHSLGILSLASVMALGNGSTAVAAGKQLPPKPGPTAPGGATPRVVGGTAVPDGKYPFQAALLAQSFGTNDRERQFCGGSLVTPDQVLTAAHCVDFFGPGPDQVPRRDLRVVVGRTVLTSSQGQRRQVTAIDIHPRWNPNTGAFDVAVVTLVSPVSGIRPVMLVTPGADALERPGTMATVTGWGNTIRQPAGPGGGGVNYPDRLREVKVPIVSRADCKTAYATAGEQILDMMLCAGRTNRDSCQGDSGGPLFFKSAGGPGYIQVGIVSSGIGCGATGFPGIYTRLSNRGVANFVLAATGGVPVTSSQVA